METPSFVSKARTAFHSAAAKAERVISDFKSDRESDAHSLKNFAKREEFDSSKNETVSKVHNEGKPFKWRPPQLGKKQDWQGRFRNIGIGKKEAEDTDKVLNTEMAVPFYDENLYTLNLKNDVESKNLDMIPSVEGLTAVAANQIPPSSVIKQLAVAAEAGRKLKSMKDLVSSPRDSPTIKERSSLSLSAVKSLVLREKDAKHTPTFGDNEKVVSLINSLFDAEGSFLRRNISYGSDGECKTLLANDIHGAPPESLVVELAEVIGNFRTVQRMAMFWCRVIVELRKLWNAEQYIPGIPKDDIPDLKCCLLYQQLQVINCCISRKKRRLICTESLNSLVKEADSTTEGSADSANGFQGSSVLYARLNSGELVLRLGASRPAENLTMLETGEPVYFPVTQEGPLLTEDLIKETEEFVLRTGSVGAGCSQLLSDMQAFKAANPGCILEDFVRWHSPPDWTVGDPSDEATQSCDNGDLTSSRGQLSTRMQKEGNLWRELWETAKPVPAVKQTPLFEEDLAVEGILDTFEEMQPHELFEQLFVSLLGLGFTIAENKLSGNSDFSKLFYECKDYIAVTCQDHSWNEKTDDICQVYETIESMLLNPEEVLKMIKQPEEPSAPVGEPKRRFNRLSIIFGGKDRQSRQSDSEDRLNSEESQTRQSFSGFFDNKSSLFSKKPRKPESTLTEKPLSPKGSDVTTV